MSNKYIAKNVALFLFPIFVFICCFISFLNRIQGENGEQIVTKQTNCDIWGTPTEKTTYQPRYCPTFDRPDIPVRKRIPVPQETTFARLDAAAVSPETAVYVVRSDGFRYSYFYSWAVRWRFVQGNPPTCVPVRVKIRNIIPYNGVPEGHPGVEWFQEKDGAMTHLRTSVQSK